MTTQGMGINMVVTSVDGSFTGALSVRLPHKRNEFISAINALL
jgi:hypothetical protein